MNKLGFSGLKGLDHLRSFAGSAKGGQMAPRSSESVSFGSFANLKLTAEKLVKEQASVKTDLEMARVLMACAQTGSGKTAAFYFPIICGIMRAGVSQQRDIRARIAYPQALILSPTGELSCQIHEEAKKFAYQTGVKVVVAYGGAPVHQQMRLRGDNKEPGCSWVELNNIVHVFVVGEQLHPEYMDIYDEVKRLRKNMRDEGYDPGLEQKYNETILVFDLGGGTFDVSVLEVGDGVF